MPGKRHRPPEFEITEQPYPIGDRSNAGANEIWRIVHQEVERLEERVAEADASLRKANEMTDAAKRRFLLDLIESVMDNLDRILAAADMVQGDARAQQRFRRFEGIRRQMEQLLARQQVVPIDVVSAPPGVVEVQDVEERDDLPDGTVVAVNWRGYLWRGEILRKPNVKVARNVSSGGGKGREATGREERRHG